MDDLEICKRIAQIEGHVVDLDDKHPRYMVFKTNSFGSQRHVGYKLFNPLTNDALCFALSKKYNVCIMHYEEYSTARIWEDPEDNPIADFSNINNDTSLNKAICLAIIELHKE